MAYRGKAWTAAVAGSSAITPPSGKRINACFVQVIGGSITISDGTTDLAVLEVDAVWPGNMPHSLPVDAPLTFTGTARVNVIYSVE